jgi:hypothetical protein
MFNPWANGCPGLTGGPHGLFDQKGQRRAIVFRPFELLTPFSRAKMERKGFTQPFPVLPPFETGLLHFASFVHLNSNHHATA